MTVPYDSAGPAAAIADDEFDLDVRIAEPWFGDAPGIRASGTCGGCPDPSEPGSTCHFSCQESCGGQCTSQADCGG
jgi:hypothetical protein